MEALPDHLVDSGRWTEERAVQLAEDLGGVLAAQAHRLREAASSRPPAG